MCRLQNIARCDNKESLSVTTRRIDKWMDRQTPDKVIAICRYAPQTTQKGTVQHYGCTSDTAYKIKVMHILKKTEG